MKQSSKPQNHANSSTCMPTHQCRHAAYIRTYTNTHTIQCANLCTWDTVCIYMYLYTYMYTCTYTIHVHIIMI